jgi:DNA polymerase (family 10)
MKISNSQVADLLRRFAGALALEGADRFRIKAYRRAADSIESLTDEVARLVANGADLTQIPGVGKAIRRTVEEIINEGKMVQLERSLSKLSPELVELSTRPALDPKIVTRIYKKLHIASLKELRQALDSGRIGEVLGGRIEFHVQRGLDERPRMLLYDAEPLAEKITRYLRSIPGVTRVAAVGSLRRKVDIIGDLNFLVAGKSAATVLKRVAEYGPVRTSEPRGRRERVFKLSSGMSASVAWTPAKEWGLEMLLRTGSKTHIEDLRRRAAQKGIRLVAESLVKKKIDTSMEEPIYSHLGLSFIEPELREGRGEVKAAAQGKLPRLVAAEDLRGDLHMHTTASDGANSIQEMAEAARARGYQYIAITDHSQSLKITNGLTEKRLLQHIKAIDKLNSRLKNFRIFKSAEVDILEDGTLDYSNRVLKELDFTICSIHSRFALDREKQTARILRAMDNPYFNILGHATGRLLLKRQGYEVDVDRIIRHAANAGCSFEINSSPDRLDLSDEHARLASEHGIKIAINTDAHSIAELDFIRAGINQARKAWLRASDVLNSLTSGDLLER